MVTAICFTCAAQSLSVGNAEMSDWSGEDVPVSGCWCLASPERGDSCSLGRVAAEWVFFLFFLILVPDGLISHFTTSQEVLCSDAALGIRRRARPANVRVWRLRLVRWSCCWLLPRGSWCPRGCRVSCPWGEPQGKGVFHLRVLSGLKHPLLFLSLAGFARSPPGWEYRRGIQEFPGWAGWDGAAGRVQDAGLLLLLM